MAARRGISLAELMLTMSACTVILTLSAQFMHRTLHAQSKSRLFFDGQRSALRLAASFRRDVHRATAAATGDETGADDLLLRLQLAGGESAEYRQAAGRVERLAYAAGKLRAREAFVFPADTRLTAEKPASRLVLLTLAPATEAVGRAERPLSSYAMPVYLRVEAVLGRNASLMEVADGQETKP
jgi:type II secretory pathway component PulJ